MHPSKFILSAVFIVIVVFSACREEEDNKPANLLLNGDVESGSNRPSHWFLPPDRDQQPFDLTWTDEEAFSPQRALKIANETDNGPEVFTFWAQGTRQNIPHEKSITLRAMIKGNMTGPGVSIAIRTDSQDSVLQFVTTEDDISITGNFDWTEHSITLENVDIQTYTIPIYLVYLPETTGEVYFDDVTLTVD